MKIAKIDYLYFEVRIVFDDMLTRLHIMTYCSVLLL
jgi:hypothetical protein